MIPASHQCWGNTRMFSSFSQCHCVLLTILQVSSCTREIKKTPSMSPPGLCRSDSKQVNMYIITSLVISDVVYFSKGRFSLIEADKTADVFMFVCVISTNQMKEGESQKGELWFIEIRDDTNSSEVHMGRGHTHWDPCVYQMAWPIHISMAAHY